MTEDTKRFLTILTDGYSHIIVITVAVFKIVTRFCSTENRMELAILFPRTGQYNFHTIKYN